MQRLAQLNAHVSAQETAGTFNAGHVGAKSDDDIVIVSYARTAMTRAKKGPQRDTAPESMLKPVLEDVLKKGNITDPSVLGEICIGNVLQPGAGSTSSRAA